MNRILYLLLGIVLAASGYGIIVQPRWHSSKFDYYFDFTGIHIPFGSAIIVIGIIFIWLALRKKAKDYEDKVLICPKCKEPFNKKDVPGERCPRCNVNLEEIEGFYDRHPELKTEQNLASKTELRK